MSTLESAQSVPKTNEEMHAWMDLQLAELHAAEEAITAISPAVQRLTRILCAIMPRVYKLPLDPENPDSTL